MFSFLTKILPAAAQMGFKALKYFVDSTFRDKVVPVPGSVLYCDLWVAVEHSGIYVGEGQISNIVVDGFAESSVCLNGPKRFTSKSTLGRKIYVSCNRYGAVGHEAVAERAHLHVGERSFYGLVFKNCHQFSTRCVNAHPDVADFSLSDQFKKIIPSETWEPTMAALKQAAQQKLGANKWRLWDWQNSGDAEKVPEPDWEAHNEYFRHLRLDPQSMVRIQEELVTAKDYETEIEDENIPTLIRQQLQGFRKTLADITAKYEQVKDFLAACPGSSFSYAQLQACTDDFSGLAAQLKSNPAIQELARKMGRNYIAEEKKKQTRIPQASRSEVHGTHRSDDVMRMLPSELLNLEDETLETLFYARLLEKNLLSYELSGTTLVQGETTESRKKRTGPVVACLDTSGSMQGEPLLKAKALLLAIANILKEEERSLHVLLFGATGEIREFSMNQHNDAAGLLKFLQQGFGGGTDFETPLRRAVKIISEQPEYVKADILMISDGDCTLSPEFTAILKQESQRLECRIYSVLCDGKRDAEDFSDETVVL